MNVDKGRWFLPPQVHTCVRHHVARVAHESNNFFGEDCGGSTSGASCCGSNRDLDALNELQDSAGQIVSSFVRARKPLDTASVRFSRVCQAATDRQQGDGKPSPCVLFRTMLAGERKGPSPRLRSELRWASHSSGRSVRRC